MRSILLVEADSITCDAWSAAVIASGHSVITASGMREAWSVVRDGGIDAVVIAAYEPHAGVAELAQHMNALPDAPPIILVSASPAAPILSVRIHAAAFVPKPCDPEEVVTAIERLLWRVRPLMIDMGGEDEPTIEMRQLA
jgi:DNA-binding response OmpR family regulator